MSLPKWMLDGVIPEMAVQCNDAATVATSRKQRRNTMRKAAGSLARILEEMLDNEGIAKKPGILQMVDPRAKVLGFIGLIVITTLLRHVSTLTLAFAMCLVFAGFSGVPMRRLARSWLVVPLFSAAIMLPATLNIVTPGHPLLTLWHFPDGHLGPWAMPPALTVTDAGIYVAGRFILRVTVCFTMVLLLTTTTRSNRLFRGLRALGVPVLFITLISMMERYLALFVRAAGEIHMAKISRSITAMSLRGEQAWVAAGMGALFRRTQSLGNGVYLAMVSRGYTGEIHMLDEPGWQLTDWAFLMIVVGFAAIMLILG